MSSRPAASHQHPLNPPLSAPSPAALPAMFVPPPPPPDPTVVLVTTLMLQQHEEQRREQQAKQASQLAAQQTQQRLKQQLMQQKQRMIAQQQQMKQKQLELQHQAASSLTQSFVTAPPSGLPMIPSTIFVSPVESTSANSSSALQQPTAAAQPANSEASTALASLAGDNQYGSLAPPPHSAVPQTDLPPVSSPSIPLAPVPSAPAALSSLSVPPITVPSTASPPPPPLSPAAVPFIAAPAPIPPASAYPDTVQSAARTASARPPEAVSPPPSPPPPSDPALLHAIDRLAEFVHRNSQFEQVIRSKHPSHAPGLFAFLYDDTCDDYQYYRWKQQQLAGVEQPHTVERSKPTAQTAARHAEGEEEVDDQPGSIRASKRKRSRSPATEHPPVESATTTALNTDGVPLDSDVDGTSLGSSSSSHSSLAAMEQYVHRLSSAHTADQRTHIPDAPSHSSASHDTRHSPDANDSATDYSLPDRFFSRHHARHSHTSRAAIAALTTSAHIDDSNVGFRLLSKMGWKGGEGLGKDGRKGRTEPVLAHTAALTGGGGLGSKEETKGKKKKRREQRQFEVDRGEDDSDEEERGDVREEEGEEDGGGGFADVYESYKRQMSMRYQHRPNPLNNPRRPY